MEYFKIDADKLNKKIEELSKIRDEAFTDFGRTYIYQGNHATYTADRKKHACLMAGCVTGLENIRAFLDVYNENKDKFTSAHEIAQKDILRYKENSQQYFVAEGMEMAFRTVLSNCLVELQQDVEIPVQQEIKYYEVDLVNYDENNVPYIVATVHFAATKQPDKNEVADFCRDNFDYDFEEVFSIEETTLDEVLEYVNESEIPTFDNYFNDTVDKLVNNATQRSKEQNVSKSKNEVEFEKE